MACVAINYNVMVSLDISVQLGNPTWPNPEVLTLRTHSCALLPTRERVVEREIGVLPGTQPVLIFAPEDEVEANNASYAHATVPPHPLSSNVSFFPCGYRTG